MRTTADGRPYRLLPFLMTNNANQGLEMAAKSGRFMNRPYKTLPLLTTNNANHVLKTTAFVRVWPIVLLLSHNLLLAARSAHGE